jgi:hypothetical protein
MISISDGGKFGCVGKLIQKASCIFVSHNLISINPSLIGQNGFSRKDKTIPVKLIRIQVPTRFFYFISWASWQVSSGRDCESIDRSVCLTFLVEFRLFFVYLNPLEMTLINRSLCLKFIGLLKKKKNSKAIFFFYI